MKKNAFLTFCFALIPGAGQMYQTYMKRGVSIMLAFALIMTITFSGMGDLTFMFALAFEAFSFFDSFNLRNMTDEARKEYKDEYIWNNLEGVIPNKIKLQKNKVIGIALIVLGVYFIALNILETFSYIDIIRSIYYTVRDCGMPTFISLAAIYFGWKMIK